LFRREASHLAQRRKSSDRRIPRLRGPSPFAGALDVSAGAARAATAEGHGSRRKGVRRYEKVDTGEKAGFPVRKLPIDSVMIGWS
jgi:hypothetical protein